MFACAPDGCDLATSREGFRDRYRRMTDDAAYEASTRRDATLDGRLFLAVRTTGVFCRPSCPARMPRRENARFFATAAEAQAAGFRACRRCHPTGG